MEKKKFRMIDVVLLVICVILVSEATAPVAAIGNSQYFWWILLIIGFLLPYGLISAELGTTYTGEGGLYDWVKRAYGSKWGTRISWYYWVNFPLWIASLAVVCPQMISFAVGREIGTVGSIIIELIFVGCITALAFTPIGDNIWILNISAAIKIILAMIIGILGLYGAVTNGVANEYTLQSLLPSFDLNSLSFVSVIIFNLLGFEVICTMADDMEDPKKQIPRAIVVGGVIIAAIYMFSAFGIGVAIPAEEINTSSGLIDAMQLLTGKQTSLFISAMAVLFMLTLFGNMISWSPGVNNLAAYAADNGDLPEIFGKRNKDGLPTGCAVLNGIVATIIVLLAHMIPSQDLFWSIFSLGLVLFLISYLPMFPAFLKLRKQDPDIERPFKVSGGDGLLKVYAALPVIFLIIAIAFTVIPFDTSPEGLMAVLPTTIGVIVFMVLGEVMIKVKKIGE